MVPTESFERTVIIDDNTVDCLIQVLESNEKHVIQSDKKFKILSRKEILETYKKQ